LERKGAKVAFITTRGFKDLLSIARQRRPRLYDFDCSRTTPVVNRNLCFEVAERLAPDGTVIVPLSSNDACALADHIMESGPEAVAICLFEKAFKKYGIPVSRSSEIIPEFREFERALQSSQRQGLNIKDIVFRPFLDLRYKGQSFHLTIPYDKEAGMAEKFYHAFEKRYGYTLENDPAVEVVTVRLSAIMPREEISLPGFKNMSPVPPAAKRTILLSSGPALAPVYQRKSLWRSFSAQGPVVIEDEGCTVFVLPECEVSAEENGCLKVIV
jgi:N-methylhydantoinase A/oxoprolinase/acetone carboxylase beta subunit